MLDPVWRRRTAPREASVQVAVLGAAEEEIEDQSHAEKNEDRDISAAEALESDGHGKRKAETKNENKPQEVLLLPL